MVDFMLWTRGPQGLLTHFIPDGKSFYFAEQVAFEAQGSCHLCVSPEHKIYISNYDSGTLTVVSDNNGHLEVIQMLLRRRKTSLLPLWPRNNSAVLILKDGELEDNWNTWVEEKMAVVQPVLDQLNK